MFIAFDMICAGNTHGAFDVSLTVTTSPLAKVVVLNVFEFVPTGLPFTYHWYCGPGPPLTGVAVNVTFCPGHIEPAGFCTILTEGTTFGCTDTVIGALGPVLGGVVHIELLYKITLTISPLTSVEVVNVLLVVNPPCGMVLTVHWYCGLVPPLVGVAVNVAGLPAHMGEGDVCCSNTAGGTIGWIFNVIGFEVTSVGDAHGSDDIIFSVTTYPSLNELVTYVGPLKAYEPFIYQK